MRMRGPVRAGPGERAPLLTAAGIAAFLACLLAADHFASRGEQLGLGALTWALLAAALLRLRLERVAQVLGVVAFATVAASSSSPGSRFRARFAATSARSSRPRRRAPRAGRFSG
jgi:hypothetical protein